MKCWLEEFETYDRKTRRMKPWKRLANGHAGSRFVLHIIETDAGSFGKGQASFWKEQMNSVSHEKMELLHMFLPLLRCYEVDI